MFKNNLFNKYQAGFLPGHSSVYQLIETEAHDHTDYMNNANKK